mmetsp:Transcript_66158/g.104698  ORF Transcript_66158/g.104698 Transcript_66158/m.104698 type:complete len:350 (+) Transcript_66158:37-1086(+)
MVASTHRTEQIQDSWLIGKMLGKGMFGHVYEVTHKGSHQVEAVKIMNTKEPKSRHSARNEARIWERIGQHRNVVKLYHIYEDQDEMFFVMDKCENTVLSRFENGLRMREMAPLLQQMLSGLAHIHQKSVVHRDIKLDNVLCVGKGIECIKICDFGLAAVVPVGKEVFGGPCGTPPYMSPEMVTGSYNTRTDIWSTGVCCFYLCSGGKFPYTPDRHSAKDMKASIRDGLQLKNFDAPEYVDIEAKKFTIELLNRTSANRPTAEEALQHSFLRSIYCPDNSEALSDKSTVASETDFQACKQHVSIISDFQDVGEESFSITNVKSMVTKRNCVPLELMSQNDVEVAPIILEL